MSGKETGLSEQMFDESFEKLLLDDFKPDQLSENDSTNLHSGSKKTDQDNLNETHDSSYMSTAHILTLPQPKFHGPASPPYCSQCLTKDVSVYSTRCKECIALLETCSIPELLAVLRQWTSCIQKNLMEYCLMLMERDCGVNDYDLVSGHTLLHFAVRCGSHNVGSMDESTKLVRHLLTSGANHYMRALWSGMMPLHYAAFFNNYEVIPLLLNHPTNTGFNIDYTCDEFDGGSSLHIAAANLSYESAKLLLEHGASLNSINDQQLKPAEVIPDVEVNSPDSQFSQSVRAMKKLFSSFEEKEMISVPNYDDVHGKALLLAMGVKIGDQVIVNDDKQGRLMFCGKTEFAGGIWAGVELKEGEGKNDGSVSGISYFKCPQSQGIFAPITKISKLGTRKTTSNRKSPRGVERGKLDVSMVTSKVDTGSTSHRSSGRNSRAQSQINRVSRSNSMCSSIGDKNFDLDDRVVVAGYKRGTVKFIGETKFAPGLWYGVELDRPIGKNDGSISGEKYFTCKSKHGVFCTVGKLKRALLTRVGSNESLNSLNSSLNHDTSWTLKVKKMAGNRSSANSIKSLGSSFNGGMSGVSTPRGSRSRSSSVSRLNRSRKIQTKSEYKLEEGMTVLFNNEMATVRYIGGVEFADGCWLGLELKTNSGRNDGEVKGHRYFSCRVNHGVMVKPSRVSVKGINGAKLVGDSYKPFSQSKPADTSDSARIEQSE